MSATKVVCPRCSHRLRVKKALAPGQLILCSRCDRSFAFAGNPVLALGSASAATPPPPPAGAMPLPASLPPGVGPAPLALTEPNRRALVRLAVVLGACAIAACAILTLVVRLKGHTDEQRAETVPVPISPEGPSPKPATSEAPDEKPAPTPKSDPVVPVPPPPKVIDPPRSAVEVVKAEPPALATPAKPRPSAAAWLPPAEQEKVNKAIERGVNYLRSQQLDSGTWPGFGFGFHHVGLAALPGLTLLECGVSANDPLVKKAARHVRESVKEVQDTYEIALSILFLDRLGDPQDEPRIRSLALRLLAGQTEHGGWTYTCPALRPNDEKNLLTVLRHHDPVERGVAGPDRPGLDKPSGETSAVGAVPVPKPTGPGPAGSTIPLAPPVHKNTTGTMELGLPPTAAEARKALEALPLHLRGARAPDRLPRRPGRGSGRLHDGSDNSNTQFAILGVWVAGRHGVPTGIALDRIARRFRVSQNTNGTWGYHFSTGLASGGSASMTGAGLLGLAVGLGLTAPDKAVRDGKQPPPADEGVAKGLMALSDFLAEDGERLNLYFLWTLERVGVLYNLRDIGGKDWYAWGVGNLLPAQRPNGSWRNNGYPGSVDTTDTCFALLFLKRANLVQDLTKHLEFVIDTRSRNPSP